MLLSYVLLILFQIAKKMGLLDDFKEVSHQQWHDKIIADLKGVDYNETLVWKSIDGIIVQPFYNCEDLASNFSKNYNLSSTSNNWIINTPITITSIEKANAKALYLLSKGANSIQFNGKISSQTDFDNLLKGIDIEIITIHFYNATPKLTYDLLSSACKKRQIDVNKLNGSISFDYLGELLTTGNWNVDEKTDFEELFQINSIPTKLRTITINGLNFNNAGATSIQELAYSFSQAVTYLNYLTEKGLDVNVLASKIQFNFGISSNYFFEIAKIRAAKILWKLILQEYHAINQEIYIHSTTSKTNYATFDAHNNILRATTEAMSAIIGGCNELTVVPFNHNFEDSTNFSERIAINIQHILKEESFLDKVSDTSKGAYYIESLTDEMVTKSLALFQEIEQKSGFLTNIKNGFIKNSIHEVANKKQEEYTTGKRTLLGVNKHQNKSENKVKITESKNSTKQIISTVLQHVIFSEEIEKTIVLKNV